MTNGAFLLRSISDHQQFDIQLLIYNFEGFKNINHPFKWSKITDVGNDQLVVEQFVLFRREQF